MFCWQARRGFAEKLEGIAGRAGSALDRHLSGCAVCNAELEGLRKLQSILSESARTSSISAEGAAFEERVLRLARSRAPMVQSNGAKSIFALPGLLPIAAASSLMVAAVVLSHFFTGAVPAGGPTHVSPAVTSQTAAADDLDDRIVAPQEVPFVIQEDLVGARRGRIPLTTYVLEPAPDEQTPARAGKPVMRASL